MFGMGGGGGLLAGLGKKVGMGGGGFGQAFQLGGMAPQGAGAGAPIMGDFEGGDAGMDTGPAPAGAAGMAGGDKGLLGGVKSPDGHKVSFADKLFAAGSVLQGDSGGAATYIQNQRNMADKLNERDRTRGITERGAKAFSEHLLKSLPPEFQEYARALPPGEMDPSKMIEMATSMAPKTSSMNVGTGLYDVTHGPFGGPGKATSLVAGAPPKASAINPDGTINEAVLQAEEQKAERIARARRKGAPQAPWHGFTPPRNTMLSDDEVE